MSTFSSAKIATAAVRTDTQHETASEKTGGNPASQYPSGEVEPHRQPDVPAATLPSSDIALPPDPHGGNAIASASQHGTPPQAIVPLADAPHVAKKYSFVDLMRTDIGYTIHGLIKPSLNFDVWHDNHMLVETIHDYHKLAYLNSVLNQHFLSSKNPEYRTEKLRFRWLVNLNQFGQLIDNSLTHVEYKQAIDNAGKLTFQKILDPEEHLTRVNNASLMCADLFIQHAKKAGKSEFLERILRDLLNVARNRPDLIDLEYLTLRAIDALTGIDECAPDKCSEPAQQLLLSAIEFLSPRFAAKCLEQLISVDPSLLQGDVWQRLNELINKHPELSDIKNSLKDSTDFLADPQNSSIESIILRLAPLDVCWTKTNTRLLEGLTKILAQAVPEPGESTAPSTQCVQVINILTNYLNIIFSRYTVNDAWHVKPLLDGISPRFLNLAFERRGILEKNKFLHMFLVPPERVSSNRNIGSYVNTINEWSPLILAVLRQHSISLGERVRIADGILGLTGPAYADSPGPKALMTVRSELAVLLNEPAGSQPLGAYNPQPG